MNCAALSNFVLAAVVLASAVRSIERKILPRVPTRFSNPPNNIFKIQSYQTSQSKTLKTHPLRRRKSFDAGCHDQRGMIYDHVLCEL